MTHKIKQLPPHEAQKIAAGQVVERPANALKELIENALDAGATTITISIEKGGKSLIRIIDNGCGMSPEDAAICFDRHTTSKLERFDELPSITTFGFRGEALASIAAAAKVTLITRDASSATGTKIEMAGGVCQSITETAATVGTDIAVTDLFYEMPARKKFLKADLTEWRHIVQLIHAFCLQYPEIHFILYSDGQQTLNCPPAQTTLERCTYIWERSVASSLLAVEQKRDTPAIALTGIIGHHQVWKYDRSTIFIFVNKRWIKNQKLGTALCKGYNNVLPAGRFPVAALFLTIDPTIVDVNTHPRKEEVALSNPRMVELLVEQAVRETLEGQVNPAVAQHCIPENKGTFSHFQAQPLVKTFRENNTIDHHHNHPVNYESVPNPVKQNAIFYHQPMTPAGVVPAPPAPLDELETPHYNLIGQFNRTYLLVEQNDNLLLFDQHAVHERILYEQFVQRFTDVASVRFTFVQTITMASADVDLVMKHRTLFETNGIIIEQLGIDQLVVQAAPVHIKNISFTELFNQAAAWLKETGIQQEDLFKMMHEKLRAQMACKAAVKAGDELSVEQMQELLTQWHQTTNRLTCPHGRPTYWHITLEQIERNFKRRL